jgi:hypothetical protein
MLKVRELYENVFNEIEGSDSDVRVVWPNDDLIPLAYPKFLTKKEYERHRIEKPSEKSILKSMKNNQLITKGSIMKFVPEEKDPVLHSDVKNDTQSDEKANSDCLNQIKSVFSSNSDDKAKLDVLEQLDFRSMVKTDLINIRENLSLEVLWIQQAIQSRIQVNF